MAGTSGLRTISSQDGSFPPSALKEAQTLAFTGLNLVARSESSRDGDLTKGSGRVFPLRQLPGAVHLLPLVQFFIGLHCQALQDSAPAKKSGAPGDSPTHTPCMSSGVEASPEDSIYSLEGFSVASLSILQHLVCHSEAVVCLLLSGTDTDAAAARKGNLLQPCADTTSATRKDVHDQNQHPLLKMLLQLLAFSSTTSGHFQASVLSQCLKVLVTLAENASSDFLPRYKDSQEAWFPLLCPDLLRSNLWLLHFVHLLPYSYSAMAWIREF